MRNLARQRPSLTLNYAVGYGQVSISQLLHSTTVSLTHCSHYRPLHCSRCPPCSPPCSPTLSLPAHPKLIPHNTINHHSEGVALSRSVHLCTPLLHPVPNLQQRMAFLYQPQAAGSDRHYDCDFRLLQTETAAASIPNHSSPKTTLQKNQATKPPKS